MSSSPLTYRYSNSTESFGENLENADYNTLMKFTAVIAAQSMDVLICSQAVSFDSGGIVVTFDALIVFVGIELMGLVRSQDFHVGKLIACGSFSS